MDKLFRKLKSRFMHWHRWSVIPSIHNEWGVCCKCGARLVTCLDEKKAKELAWKNNVTSGNLKANYINNGVLKTEKMSGIKLP
jgi:hypothetical protein